MIANIIVIIVVTVIFKRSKWTYKVCVICILNCIAFYYWQGEYHLHTEEMGVAIALSLAVHLLRWVVCQTILRPFVQTAAY